jgi:diguanylate cyclase (GGDEF)-like protein
MLSSNTPLTQKIIIIDDNVNIHQDFIKILNSSKPKMQSELENNLFGQANQPLALLPDFEIHTAIQGLEGIEKIAEASAAGLPFSIAFVDVRMPPGLDGIETIKRIFPIDPNIQVVICSAFSDYTWEQTAENLGIRDNLLILKKPFDSIAVRQLVCALSKKSSLLSELRETSLTLESALQDNKDKLQTSMALARATLDSTTEGILIVDNKGSILDYNLHFCRIWNIPNSMMKSNNKNIILDYVLQQLDKPEILIDKLKELSYNIEKTSTAIYSFKDGRIIEQFSLPHLLDGNVVGRILTFRDVSEKHHLTQKLEHQANHDALTDLPNRLLLYDRLNQAIAHASRHQAKVGVFFLDLDRFKLINDSLSHDAGDELLKAVSQRILKIQRDEDTVARLGGDEFVIITPSIYNHENLLFIASKIQSIFKEPFDIAGRPINISSSIGISVYPEDGNTPEELLRNADLAMYASKSAGLNQYQFYIQKLNDEAIYKLQIETELRSALTQDQFKLYYQPQYNSMSNQVVAIEALIRWEHPSKGLLTPLEFLPQAEECGLIIPIGEWVLRTACLQNKQWQNSNMIHTKIAVNISAQQLKSTFFVSTVKKILSETGLNGEYLELELTEDIILSDPTINETLDKLRQMNISVALDDFGAGNSSLSYLRNSNIDRIKIDQSFIKNIDINSKDEVMIQSILNIAKSLDLNVVAEGVETIDQMDFLKNLSCPEIQGYYYSQPLTLEQLEAFLKKQRP